MVTTFSNRIEPVDSWDNFFSSKMSLKGKSVWLHGSGGCVRKGERQWDRGRILGPSTSLWWWWLYCTSCNDVIVKVEGALRKFWFWFYRRIHQKKSYWKQRCLKMLFPVGMKMFSSPSLQPLQHILILQLLPAEMLQVLQPKRVVQAQTPGSLEKIPKVCLKIYNNTNKATEVKHTHF